MLAPVADFNFVVCGFATVAATVGYACSRRYTSQPNSAATHLSLDPAEDGKSASSVPSEEQPEEKPSSPSQAQEIGSVDETTSIDLPVVQPIAPSTVLSRRSSLKRKRLEDDDYSDAGYPLNLLSIYPPAKRSKTPPGDKGDDDTEAPESTDTLASGSPDLNTAELEHPPSHQPKIEESESSVEVPPSLIASEHRSDATDSDVSDGPATPPNLPVPLPPSPQKESKDSSCFDNTTTATAITKSPPRTPAPPKRCLPIGSGFAAFAGKGSGFGSPFKTTTSPEKPAWCTPSSFKSGSSTDIWALGSPEKVAIAPVEVPSATPQAHVTGEEDETVELELKNVKLFVKRGKKNFSEGMIGHVKLLSHNSSRDERLLFRREPLWKVSMNVRLNSSMRCTFDAEDHVLRVVLAEAVETAGVPVEQWPREVTVYALKPGRSLSKSDFKDFAEALIARSSLTTKAKDSSLS